MINVNLELCKIFYEVAEEKNITKAAEKLFISQPAVSQAIKKLESELGGTLFLRSNKGLTLTEEGKIFLTYVSGAMNLINNATIEFNNFKELKTGTIKIGVSTTLAKAVLLKPMQIFHQKYPNVYFQIVNALTANLLLDLEKGNLDFVIMNEGDGENKSFEVITLKEVESAFLYAPEFFNYNGTYTLEQVSKMPLILQNKKANSQQFLEKICLKQNIVLRPTMEVVSQELCLEIAKVGFGITFAPVENSGLEKIKLKEKLPNSKIQLVTNKFYSLSFAAKTFLEELRIF